MYGSIPSIDTSECGQDQYVIKVGGDNGWSQGQRYQPIRMLQGDSLNFEFQSPDNVYLMENKVAIFRLLIIIHQLLLESL